MPKKRTKYGTTMLKMTLGNMDLCDNIAVAILKGTATYGQVRTMVTMYMNHRVKIVGDVKDEAVSRIITKRDRIRHNLDRGVGDAVADNALLNELTALLKAGKHPLSHGSVTRPISEYTAGEVTWMMFRAPWLVYEATEDAGWTKLKKKKNFPAGVRVVREIIKDSQVIELLSPDAPRVQKRI